MSVEGDLSLTSVDGTIVDLSIGEDGVGMVMDTE